MKNKWEKTTYPFRLKDEDETERNWLQDRFQTVVLSHGYDQMQRFSLGFYMKDKKRLPRLSEIFICFEAWSDHAYIFASSQNPDDYVIISHPDLWNEKCEVRLDKWCKINNMKYLVCPVGQGFYPKASSMIMIRHN